MEFRTPRTARMTEATGQTMDAPGLNVVTRLRLPKELRERAERLEFDAIAKGGMFCVQSVQIEPAPPKLARAVFIAIYGQAMWDRLADLYDDKAATRALLATLAPPELWQRMHRAQIESKKKALASRRATVPSQLHADVEKLKWSEQRRREREKSELVQDALFGFRPPLPMESGPTADEAARERDAAYEEAEGEYARARKEAEDRLTAAYDAVEAAVATRKSAWQVRRDDACERTQNDLDEATTKEEAAEQASRAEYRRYRECLADASIGLRAARAAADKRHKEQRDEVGKKERRLEEVADLSTQTARLGLAMATIGTADFLYADRQGLCELLFLLTGERRL